jgi:hypothetical protein
MPRQDNTGQLSVSILDGISKHISNLNQTTNKNAIALQDILGLNKKLVSSFQNVEAGLTSMLSVNKKTVKTDAAISTNKLEVLSTDANKYLAELVNLNKNNTTLKETSNSIKQEFEGFGMLAGSVANLIVIAGAANANAGKNIENTLNSLINSMQPIFGKTQQLQESGAAIMIMAQAVVGLGKSLAISTPLYLIGTIGSALSALNISILSYVLARIDAKNVAEGAQSVKTIGYAVLIMGLSIAAFSYIVDPQTAFVTALSVTAISAAFYFIGMGAKTIDDGAKALLWSGLSIASLGFGIALFVAFVQSPMAVFAVSLSILAVGGAFYLIGKGATDVLQGGLAIGLASLSIGFLGYSIGYFQSQNVDLETIGILALSIVTVGGAMFLAGKFAGTIAMGSLAMILASVPVIMISYALKTFQDSEIGLDTVGVMGASLLAVGTAMGIAGLVSPVLIAGSVAMILGGAAISVIASALSDFKKIDFTEEDSKNLNFALSAVRVAFTGGEGAQGGILSSIGGFFSSIFDSGSMILNAGSMLVAGAALSTISMGLTDFKKVTWSEQDSQAMTSVFSSLIKSFSLISDKNLQKEYGIDISPFDLYLGIESLSSAGNTITSLAQGVASFAALSFDEYTYDKQSKKMIVTGKTKLSASDITTAGDNISKVISVVGSAFAEVGKLDYGESSTNSFLTSIFGGGYVSTGVRALSSAGYTVKSLAQGVKEFANLSFTEYEVKDKKLVPKTVTKLSSSDIQMAGDNISTVISTVGAAFAEVGKLDAGEGSNNGILAAIFGGGGQYVRRGVEALAGSGKLIVDLGQGVKDFASLSFTEFEVQDVDGKPTIVPKKVTKMQDTDFTMATDNITKVISTVANVFADVGRINAGDTTNNSVLQSIFGTGMVQQGVESLNGVGGNLIAIADAIPKYANLQFTKMGVKDINGVPTVVPVEFVTITQPELTIASLNISKILGLVAASFAEVGKMAVEGSGWFADGYITEGVEALKGVGENLSGIVESVLKVAAMQMPVYGTDGKIASYVKLDDAALTQASMNIRKILNMTAETYYNFGMEYGESSEKYESLKEGINVIGKVSSAYGSAIESLTGKITESTGLEAAMTSFSNGVKTLTTTIFDVFDMSKDKDVENKAKLFTGFVGGVSKISDSSTNLTNAANSFEKMSNSMKVFKDSINSLDLKKAGLADSIFSSLAALANVKGGIDSLARTLNDSIKTSFDRMVELLESLNGASLEQTNATQNVSTEVSTLSKSLMPTIPSFTNTTTQPKVEQPVPPTAQQQPMSSQILTEIDTTLRNIANQLQRAISKLPQ